MGHRRATTARRGGGNRATRAIRTGRRRGEDRGQTQPGNPPHHAMGHLGRGAGAAHGRRVSHPLRRRGGAAGPRDPLRAGRVVGNRPDRGGRLAAPARSWRGALARSRASRAVSGGVSILFGAAYGFAPLYGLWPPSVAFPALAAVSFAGLALSLRSGPLVAAIGLAGSYASPILVATDQPWAPGLYLYLLAVTAAALGVVRFTAWVWLGWTATVGAALWVLLGVAAVTAPDVWASAMFAPAAAALSLVLLPREAFEHPIGRRLVWVPVGCLGVAALALAQTWRGRKSRTGVLLLAPLCLWKATAELRLRALPACPPPCFWFCSRYGTFPPRPCRHWLIPPAAGARPNPGRCWRRRRRWPGCSPPPACSSRGEPPFRCPGRRWPSAPPWCSPING